MQQRVAIVRALALDPPLLLMDEPFGALDDLTRKSMQMLLLDIWSKTKKTILIVTHSISEACFMSDRVVILSPRPGRITRIISIPLGRPRERSMVETKAFGRICGMVREALGSGGIGLERIRSGSKFEGRARPSGFAVLLPILFMPMYLRDISRIR